MHQMIKQNTYKYHNKKLTGNFFQKTKIENEIKKRLRKSGKAAEE